MRLIEVENWVLSVVERLRTGEQVEETRVELKADWPDPVKAARRLAGQANAARGATVLWLVGADEKKQALVGARREDLEKWWPQVQSCFVGESPALECDIVPDGVSPAVVGLQFRTDRPPYVVKNPVHGQDRGPIEAEVPWREGTRVRTARRADLLRLLVPMAQRPQIEVLGASLRQHNTSDSLDRQVEMLALDVDIYIEAPADSMIYFPFHRCTGRIEFPGPGSFDFARVAITLRARPGSRGTVENVIADSDTLGVRGCLRATACGYLSPEDRTKIERVRHLVANSTVTLRVQLAVANESIPLSINARLEPVVPQARPNVLGQWRPV